VKPRKPAKPCAGQTAGKHKAPDLDDATAGRIVSSLVMRTSSLQDANSGNAGDLVKHSVNLQTLALLLEYKPLSKGIQLHECHAGRGLYQPRNEPGKEQNGHNVQTLLASNLPLAKWQRKVLDSRSLREAQPRSPLATLDQHRQTAWLCGEPSLRELTIADGKWYAGSACLNAAMLMDEKHDAHFYETDVCADLESRVKPLKGNAHIYCPCDGEKAIAQQCERLDSHCIVILDPFDLPATGARLEYYKQILRAVANQAAAPALLFFYAWGSRHSSDARDFRSGRRSGKPVEELRDIIGQQAIEILWCRRRHYAMWVVVPPAIRQKLFRELDVRVEEIKELLRVKDTGSDLKRWVVRSPTLN